MKLKSVYELKVAVKYEVMVLVYPGVSEGGTDSLREVKAGSESCWLRLARHRVLTVGKGQEDPGAVST